jgi:hypothetical protein
LINGCESSRYEFEEESDSGEDIILTKIFKTTSERLNEK